MITAGIIGGAGYTGGELIRILLNHSEVTIDFVYSQTHTNKWVYELHPDVLGQCDLRFTDDLNRPVDVLFLCTPHGASGDILKKISPDANTRVIDLSNQYRLSQDAERSGYPFVYGLPELQRETIVNSHYIANPGCFATAITLALLPLAKKGWLTEDVHINGITGSTGAGAGLSETSHFTWRDNNVSWYKPFSHQHIPEIKQSLSMNGMAVPSLYFLPHRGNFSRGIFVTAYMPLRKSIEEICDLYEKYYNVHPFVHVSKKEISLKQVVNTNQCVLHLCAQEGVLLITSCIDNLIKGASGQAVQNMNLLFGFDERTGLLLKGTNF